MWHRPLQATISVGCAEQPTSLSRAIAMLMKITKGEITVSDNDNTNAVLILMDQIHEKHKTTESGTITFKVAEAKKRGSMKRTVE